MFRGKGYILGLNLTLRVQKLFLKGGEVVAATAGRMLTA